MEQSENNMYPNKSSPFTPKDWLAVVLALCCAVLWFNVFSFEAIMTSLILPGLGAAAVTASLWCAVLIYLGKNACWNKYNIFLSVGVGFLTCCLFIYGNISVRLINYLLILCGSALCFFSLSGKAQRPLANALCIPETFILTFRAMFFSWFAPFRAIVGLRNGDRSTVKQVILGIVISLPVLALVIWLLSGADAVFGSMFSGIADWFGRLELGAALWKFFRVLILTLVIFSSLFFLLRGSIENLSEKEKKAPPAAPFITALTLLDIVYILFVVIQFAFLFGGNETAAMEGGYAEYARNGFFQLLYVAMINLTAALICSTFCGDCRLVRVLSSLLLALTFIIVFSAFWRMRLYILAYGLTLLRAMTLWAMAFITVCLSLAALKIWKRGFRFWPLFAAVGLVGWLIFNFVNIDARIGDYNVDAYLDGRLEHVDIAYLSELSPDVVPSLERLRDSVGGDYTGIYDDIMDLDDAIEHASVSICLPAQWQGWCLAYEKNS